MTYKKLIIHTDGGARGNPGPAAIGVVVETDTGKLVKQYSEYIGEATNNIAEYRAVAKALQIAKGCGACEVDVFVDSELIARQLQGRYKIKNESLGKWFIKIWNMRQQFQRVDFHHIPRIKNKNADCLVNQALDKKGGI